MSNVNFSKQIEDYPTFVG